MAFSTIPTAGLSTGGANFRNLIINGDMSIAQRGTSVSGVTGDGYRTCDRWRLQITTAGTWTISQSTDVPTGQGFGNSFKLDCTTADASLGVSDGIRLETRLEGQNLQMLKKGTSNAESTTLSFWVKSNKTGTYPVTLRDVDNSRLISKTYTINSASTWEKKTLIYDGDTTGALNNDNGESLRFEFWLGAGTNFTSGTAQTTWGASADNLRASGLTVNLADSTSNYINFTGVQLEVGTSASDFEFLPYDVNLNRCQRYFQETQIGVYFDVVSGRNYGVNSNFHTQMRTTPSVISSTTIDNNNRFTSGAINGSPFLSTHGILAHKGAIATSDAGYYQTLVTVDAEL